MSTKNNGGPAFPLPAEQCIYDESRGMIGTEGYGRHAEYGMTLRDYFAAKALSILLFPSASVGHYPSVAVDAYKMADAMLAARGDS